jgi:molecular chaperone DnaK (HSP70)
MSKILGIDLGPINSWVTVVEAGEPVIITMVEDRRLLPLELD